MVVETIPLMTIDEQNSSRPDRLKTRALEAWRFTVASGSLAGVLILIINIITLAILCAKYHIDNNSLTIFTGKCHTTSVVTTIAHVIINILSTILLAYSNFSMQCLNSPTRKEINTAHSKHYWLNIGTPSVRNLLYISKKKRCLWLVLALSSFPLHMVWNAVVFQTQTTNNYLAVTVTENFLKEESWDVPSISSYGWFNVDDSTDVGPTPDYESIVQDLKNQTSDNGLDRLSPEDCIEDYYKQILPDRKHVLLVVADSYESNGSSVLAIYDNRYYTGSPGLFQWMCDADSTSLDACFTGNTSKWVPGKQGSDALTLGDQNGAPVLYCYSQKATTDQQCKIHVVPVFLGVVIACNVFKIICFLSTLYLTKKDTPLCTIGDAIQSFLKDPDPHTQGRCLAEKADYDILRPSRSTGWISRPADIGDFWRGGRARWFRAVNTWLLLFYLISMIVMVSYAATSFGIGSRHTTWKTVMALGFSQPDTRFELLSRGTGSILTAFLLANVPQVLVSYIYLTLNNIMTAILVMAEWCGYSAASNKPPKGLRVSKPIPDTSQRSTYFFSVPYKWSIPSTITITVIHWLVSEMVFFNQIDVHLSDPGQLLTSNHIFYSPTAMLPAVILGCLVMGILLGFALFRQYPAAMPLAGGCSASMAAACQPSRMVDGSIPTTFPPDLSHGRLKWGVVQSSDDEAGGIGHATFSGDDVTPLVREKLYT